MDNVGITRNHVTEQSPATGGGLHAIFCGDIVLDNKWNAMKRTTNLALGTLIVELVGNGEGVRVKLKNGTGGIVRIKK